MEAATVSLLSVMLAAFLAMPWWVTKLVNSLRDELSAKMDATNARIDQQRLEFTAGIADQRRELSAQIGALSKDVAELGIEVAVLKNDVAGLKEDVAVLQKDMTGLKEDVVVLKNDVSGLKDDVAGLQKDMTGLHERMDRVEARLPEPPAPAAD